MLAGRCHPLAPRRRRRILNLIDDHSRLAIASVDTHHRVRHRPVDDTVTAAVDRWGTPASVLTDNGAIFTATPRRGGRTALQVMLGELGINYLSSRPYQPQTCGKVERMPIVSKQYKFVIGVDTHAATHSLAVVIAVTGAELDPAAFPNTWPGLDRAVGWIAGGIAGPSTMFVIEGVGSYGAGLASASPTRHAGR